MARPEVRAEYRTRLPQAFTLQMQQVAAEIGAGPMTKKQLVAFKDNLNAQLARGLRPIREDHSNLPRLMAIKSGVKPITEAQWHAVKAGKTALVGEGGGTNINVRRFTKVSDTQVEISDPLEPTIVVPQNERTSTFDLFIRRIAEPLARQAAILGRDRTPVSIGLSLGQPNSNFDHPHGIDAVLLPHTVEGGTALLSNNYAITDWTELTEQDRRVMGALGRSIQGLNRDLHLDAMVGENDTISNGQDSVNAATARQIYQSEDTKVNVLPNGHVKGTGNNDAILMEAGYHPSLDYAMQPQDAGYVNTEDGNALVEDNLVSQRARKILIDRKHLKKEDNKPILERRTGEHAPARLAAAVELFAEAGLIDLTTPSALTDTLLNESKKNPAFVDDIIFGNFPKDINLDATSRQIIQGLAQGLREQEAQIYGVQLAVMTAASGAPKPENTTRLVGVEGSAFNLGAVGQSLTATEILTNKSYAEAVSAENGEPVTVYKSSGLTGIGVATLVKAA